MPHDYKDRNFWEQQVFIGLPLIHLLTIHGNLCLALRHPQNRGVSREITVSAVKQIGKYLVDLGALTPEQLREAERIEVEEGSPDLGGIGNE